MRRTLRVKTGSLRCRKRRKKCDELKPVCGACRRWNFACVRPHPGDGLIVRDIPLRNTSDISPAVNGHGFPAFRDQTQLSLLQEFSSVYQTVISPLAGGDYENVSQIFVIALGEAWIRDALNAFTGYMMYARTQDCELRHRALLSYQTAVGSMKDRLSHPLQHGQELGVLVAAAFLGSVELVGTADADLALGHYALVARLGRPLFAQPCSDRTVLSLYRIMLEGVVYNLAYQSMLQAVPNVILQAVDWTIYDRIFRQLPGSDAPDSQLSPHLGGNHDFYRLTLEITCFSRESHSQEVRTSQVRHWLSQIEHLERRLKTYYVGAPVTAARLSTVKCRLYALALRIYCMRLEDQDLRTWRPSVIGRVYKVQRSFIHSALAGAVNPVLAWPLIVFLCPSSGYTVFNFISDEVEKVTSSLGLDPLCYTDAIISGLRWIHRA